MLGVSEMENKIAGHENLIKTVFNGAFPLPCLTASRRRRFVNKKALMVQGRVWGRAQRHFRQQRGRVRKSKSPMRVQKSNLNVRSIIYESTVKLKTHLATETLCGESCWVSGPSRREQQVLNECNEAWKHENIISLPWLPKHSPKIFYQL